MRRSNANLANEVAALGDLSRSELAALWEKTYGHSPPKSIRFELLLRSATWQLQAKRLGGLSPATRRMLKTAMADAEVILSTKALGRRVAPVTLEPAPEPDVGIDNVSDADAVALSSKPRRRNTVSPGARLVREWNGKTHVVDVVEEGFVFQAKVHKSLTAIAHQITGAHWSGPRFFGL